MHLEEASKQLTAFCEDSKHLTALCTPFGVFECNVLPMGVNVRPEHTRKWYSMLFDITGLHACTSTTS